MPDVLKSLEPSGGYAILLGVVIVGLFWLTQRWVDTMAKRSVDREEWLHAEHIVQIERERQNTQCYRETTERVIGAIDRNTIIITTMVEIVRSLSDTMQRLDKHIGSTAAAPRPTKKAATDE